MPAQKRCIQAVVDSVLLLIALAGSSSEIHMPPPVCGLHKCIEWDEADLLIDEHLLQSSV